MPIALLTDFGTSDYYVAAMKGVIYSINASANVIDITHDIGPQDVASAAFILQACHRDFPAGTIFLCVVDPGVGSNRRPIIAQTDRYFFVGPDNGLFSFVLDDSATVHAIENRRFFPPLVSSTFHGRDVFAPVAAFLSEGIKITEFGPRIHDAIVLPDTEPIHVDENTIEGRVIHIDRFGNLITNFPSSLAERFSKIDVGRISINDLQSSYAEAGSDRPFAIVGSAGFIEISVMNGSAAETLKCSNGTNLTFYVA
jgi:S-adenosylmethionine hydrolase